MGCSLPSEGITGHLSRPGDIVIGGTFMVHLERVYSDLSFTYKPPELQCQMFALQYYQSMRALIFAVEEINANPKLLPNITLGFQVIDSCNNLRPTAQGTLSMLSGGKEVIPNFHCRKEATLAGIIGDTGSTRSILMAHILGLYRYPQISYFATNPKLSDRNLFPSFFRTIPSDEYQMRGLAQLVRYFDWSWVGLLANDNDYGQYGLQMVKQEIMNGGACVAFTENILTARSNRNAPHLVRVIKESTAKVVVVITTDSDFLIVAEELLRQNVTDNIWVASEAWSTTDLLSSQRFKPILLGTIGFAIHRGQMPKFSRYLSSLRPTDYLYDWLMRELWELVFSCKWSSHENVTVDKACTGNEKLESILTEEDYRVSLNVYTAMYAIAWALQSLHNCTTGYGPFYGGGCANITSFHPWQLLHYIKNVNFKTEDGSPIFFDAKGNPPAVYDIVNWRQSRQGTLEQVTIGRYDLSAPNGKILNVDSADVIWINDAAECQPCSWDTWPNPQHTRCLPRPTEFLSYEEPLGYSLVVIAILSSLIPLVILGVFIRYNKTPIVRANNYSLSCLLLLSLFLCFLCSLGFIGYPQPEKCLLRQVAFGMVFALCISCVLAKTITVVIAFNATKPGSRLRKWTGVKVSYCLILFCVFIQLFLCIMWLIFSPPFHELDTDTKPEVIVVCCNEGSPTAFWCMLGYLGLLASISFIVAFLARRLPDSFNEAKLITFTMLAFLSVWVSFIPAYLSARGMYTVAMEVFAILSSSWAVVGCIFVPKCYIILFKPNRNSRELLMGKGRNQK
ncbi:extracellular calcium-sensing receptor [Xenopus tropicalis]|uniref:Extracellular calcium-sensing receptor n=1 Tax=Xenopus tropicalis TaxID=8364 RepID=A0A8J1J8F5_XENTR|nr:extracellular calcium-sensing receptor [Xenopus tropicalis]